MTRQLDTVSIGMRLLDRYTITGKLGQGGFAVVYSARDELVERPVAIKILNVAEVQAGDPLHQGFAARFEREAKAAARIRHPHIMTIHDYGILPDHHLPYIVMELLDGEDLDDHLRRHGPMRPERLLPLFCGALDALGAAHKEGVVHRDLKPSNLFLRSPGGRGESLCIVDFGIAHVQDMRTRLTQTGHVVGTPAYVAPEYATRQHVSPALDVYQMGLILIECLQGRPVVEAPQSLIAMFQHVYGNISVPAPLLDCPLGPVLQKALAWDPDRRYLHAGLFAAALAELDPAQVPRIEPDQALTLRVDIKTHPSRTRAGLPPLHTPDAPALDRLTEAQLHAVERGELALADTAELMGVTLPEMRLGEHVAGAEAADASAETARHPALTPARREPLAAPPSVRPHTRQGPQRSPTVETARRAVLIACVAMVVGGVSALTFDMVRAWNTPETLHISQTTGLTTGGLTTGQTTSGPIIDTHVDEPVTPDVDALLDPSTASRSDKLVLGAVLANQDLLRPCMLRGDAPQRRAEVTTTLTLAPSGAVTRAQLASDDLPEPIRRCLLHELAQLTGPRAPGASSHTVTFRLGAPRGGEDTLKQHLRAGEVDALQRCYTEQSARDPKTPRRYIVRAVLHATAGGTITRVQLTPLGAREVAWQGQDALHRCLMTTMQQWRLRADSPRQLTVPLRLSR